LADYRSSGGNEKDNDDEDKGQEFFAGGSEHSGQMISGPPKKKRDIAKDMFDAAKKQGAVPLEEIEKDKKPSKFVGTGFRLGDTEGPSDTIPGLSISSTSRVTRTLTFWSGGFTVDHGPLRTGDTQQDKDFLDSVSKGEIPQELLKDARGREININLEDKRNETFKPKLVPFSGSGQKLGNLTPDFSPSTITQGATPTPQSAPPPTVTLDTSQPVTSVQIRLADGTRLVAKFNHFHTIQDIRQYIISARPEMAARDFTLQTTFPNKVLTDMSQSLVEANLLNAVVVQRFQ
jgi:UBX domain-containing protein 1